MRLQISTVCLALLLLSKSRLPGAELAADEFQGMSVGVFLPAATRSAATLHVDRGYTDYERRGFYRIGLLPVFVFDGVTIDLRQPRDLAPALQKTRWLLRNHRAARRVELRHVTIRFPPESGVVLRADRLRFDEAGLWLLTEPRGIPDSGEPLQNVAEATLEVAGEHAGRLTWESRSGRHTLDLLRFQVPTTDIIKPLPEK